VRGRGKTGITLGQVAVDAKIERDHGDAPSLLELLDLRDKIVTTDAMGCQKDIAATIVPGGGDYIFSGQRQSAHLARRD